MITAVFLDLDDTLADLRGGFLAATGLPLSREWEKRIGKKSYWDKVDTARPGFWKNLNELNHARDLLHTCILNFDTDDVHILSAVFEKHEECEEEKRVWCRIHTTIPDDNVHIVKRSEKRDFADSTMYSRGHLLIDDNTRNCREWEDAGGCYIQHDPNDVYRTVRKLKELIDSRGVIRL